MAARIERAFFHHVQNSRPDDRSGYCRLICPQISTGADSTKMVARIERAFFHHVQTSRPEDRSGYGLFHS
jgi:hypothetical protein